VLIRSPSRYDPEVSPEDAQDRWGLVLDAMVEEGWMSAEEREASVYPPVLPKAGSSLGMPTGPEGLIVARVLAEMEGRHGYDEQQIRAGGLRITTTVEAAAQNAAVTAVDEVMADEPDNLREALVAVDPRTGGVRAYYGGAIGAGEGAIDYARAQRQPGSSVKPYVLATALEQGISVTARRDGSSPQTFPDRPPNRPVRNSGGASCGSCTLTEAITRSLNTTFYGLTYEVGPQKVRETILEATGLPEVWEGGNLEGNTTLADPETGGTDSGLGIGQYEMRPIDQAVGFATFASGGIQRDPYFVAKVADNAGTVLLENTGDPGEQVMDSDVASDVTYAIRGVADYSKRSLDGDREVASKTGTVGSSDEDNSDAWMVGYTPSISAAVWMGSDGNDPIVNERGAIIYGSGLPGAIWQQFMDTVLADTPEENLPDRPTITGDTGEGVPEPTPTQQRTSETPAPSSTPTPTPSPKTTPTPVTPVSPVVPPEDGGEGGGEDGGEVGDGGDEGVGNNGGGNQGGVLTPPPPA
jgi:membrane peptidoglycan carboxypeptidase